MTMKTITTHTLGYPRMGEKRELKKALEAYWQGKLSRSELEDCGRLLRGRHWEAQRAAGIEWVACNDFSFYDQVLDTTCMVGNVPPRFGWNGGEVDLDTRFLIARGKSVGGECDKDCQTSRISTFASEMTKWFDTNYHYIVPEFRAETSFSYSSNKAVDEFLEAKALGFAAKPVLVGPVTYLSLGKVVDAANPGFDRFALLDRLLPVYEAALRRLHAAGAEWVQIDEPILCCDLEDAQREALRKSCAALKAAAPQVKVLLATYFGELRDNLSLACGLDCDALHIDAVRGGREIEAVATELPLERTLSLGLVDGRNVWKNDYCVSFDRIETAQALRGESGLMLSSSCSLLHSPATLRGETALDGELKGWLAFAEEKLSEITDLARIASGEPLEKRFAANLAANESRRNSDRIHNAQAQARLGSLAEPDYRRKSPFPQRQRQQRQKLALPAFPTTTIGSFPQTQEVRAARAKWRKGELSDGQYDAFLKAETRRCVAFQEEIGIDMPVHGEFERNDMVEYFGEQLEGFAFTRNGWVQSYGSRCVKPPIIFGDVWRPKPMTVYWAEYAQSLTSRPMKGMLTGPVTILQWSFARDDQPRETTAGQIALAVRDEVADLEACGIAAIQIDEPAFREGLPLRREDWQGYLDWAVACFRLSSCSVADETQIHTHMCYSEFNDIIQAIADLDADVITIETSRSNMELLDAFVAFNYPAEIGPGVYDIHSPRVPETREMQRLMEKALQVLPAENLWVNPDCGLKTRGWAEVEPSLTRMVQCAKELRSQVLAT